MCRFVSTSLRGSYLLFSLSLDFYFEIPWADVVVSWQDFFLVCFNNFLQDSSDISLLIHFKETETFHVEGRERSSTCLQSQRVWSLPAPLLRVSGSPHVMHNEEEKPNGHCHISIVLHAITCLHVAEQQSAAVYVPRCAVILLMLMCLFVCLFSLFRSLRQVLPSVLHPLQLSV